MAEQDHSWDRTGSAGAGGQDGGAIDRLEAALARIAAAAGRRQDALRVAELTARAAQHEADLLVEAEERRRAEAEANRVEQFEGLERARAAELQRAAETLDSLIGLLRAELDAQPAEG